MSKGYRKVYYEEYPETPKEWEVHHIDGDKTNSSLDNLIALPRPVHMYIHKVQTLTKSIMSVDHIKQELHNYINTLNKMSRLASELEDTKRGMSKYYVIYDSKATDIEGKFKKVDYNPYKRDIKTHKRKTRKYCRSRKPVVLEIPEHLK